MRWRCGSWRRWNWNMGDDPKIRRVWVISELYYPEETSTGHFLTQIAEGLARYHPVSVLCSQPTYSARGVRAQARETRNGVDIRRCGGATLNKDRLPFRMINLATISLSVFCSAVLRIRRDDAVLVVTNPPLLPFVVYIACRWHRARCLLLIHDVYPEVLVAAGMIRPDSLLARWIGRLTRWLYKGSDRIIVLGRDMQELVGRKLGVATSRVVIIPNWADVTEIAPIPREQNLLLRQLGLIEKFVVQYSGNMGRTHDLESLVACAALLKKRSDVHFLLIGSGAKKAWLEDAIRREGLPNATVMSARSRSELSDSLSACDLAFLSFIPGMAGVSVPSRMYNILAAGKPILAAADSESELARVVLEERVGWVVDPGCPDKTVQTILAAKEAAGERAEMAGRARAAAEKKYTLDNVVTAYQNLLAGLEK